MPYPPTPPAAGRTNATPQLDTHPGDHNTIAAMLAAIPWGPAAPTVYQTAQQNISSTSYVDLTSLALTVPLQAGRRYRFYWSIATLMSVAQGQANVALCRADNTSLVESADMIPLNFPRTLTGWFELTAAATGAQGYKLRAKVTAGTMATFAAGAGSVSFAVDDIGKP